jgi:hypothetical protein
VSQSRRQSLIETSANGVVGGATDFAANPIVLPAFWFLGLNICLALPGPATPRRALHVQQIFQKYSCDGGRHELVVW